jgi:hypothetical protein
MIELWKLGAVVNIAVISMVYWNLTKKPQDELDKVFGYQGFSMNLLIVMWTTIAIISVYILVSNSTNIAIGLYTFQLLYKLIAWLALDINAKNPITRTNLVVIPFLLLSLYGIKI